MQYTCKNGFNVQLSLNSERKQIHIKIIESITGFLYESIIEKNIIPISTDIDTVFQCVHNCFENVQNHSVEIITGIDCIECKFTAILNEYFTMKFNVMLTPLHI